MVLIAGVVLSFGWSVLQTSSNPIAAYFSPFTRAWELAVGAFLAVNVSVLKQLPSAVARVMGWLGLGVICYAAATFNGATIYPGSAVAIPVIGAALVIGGGVCNPRMGVEVLLGKRPALWLGRRSYSLYLWHFPVLIIVLEYSGKKGLTNVQTWILIGVSVLLAMITYRFVENPVRHSRLKIRTSIVLGLAAIAVTLITMTILIIRHTSQAPVYRVTPASGDAAVVRAVDAAPHIPRGSAES